MFHIIEYNGRLGITLGWQANWNESVEERHITLLPRYFTPDTHPHWVGATSGRVEHNSIHFHDKHFNTFWVDTDGMEGITEKRPVKKPRDGKYYTWEWMSGKWYKTSR